VRVTDRVPLPAIGLEAQQQLELLQRQLSQPQAWEDAGRKARELWSQADRSLCLLRRLALLAELHGQPDDWGDT
jgi:hypothetical protein